MTGIIRLSDLRVTINRIFDHIENDLGRRSVELSKDYYWEVPANERFDMTKDPSGYDCGQLSDDWEFLGSILENNDNAFALMLIHAAPLLQWLGEEIGQ